MPAYIKNIRSPDQWLDTAQKIATRVTNGPGSMHARVQHIRDLLIAVATENYEAGKAEAIEDVRKGTESALTDMMSVEHGKVISDASDTIGRLRQRVDAKDESPTPDMYH